jgi:hypothetical protein
MPGFAPVQKAPAVAPAQKNKKQAAAIQPKLSVNTPGDRYEKEADRTADRVMRSPASGPVPAISTLGASAQRATTAAATPKRDEKQKVQRAAVTATITAPKREDKKNAAPAQVQRATSKLDDGVKTLDRHTRELARDHGRDPRLQRKTEEVKPDKPKSNAPAAVQRDSAGGGGGEAPSGFETTLSRAQQAGGDTLASGTMQRMETGFGRSFGDVRVHSDGAADTAAKAIDARAFTLGRDIYFAQGQYQPHSASGQHLLAHELTHVVQQSGQAASPQMAQRKQDKKDSKSVKATPTPAEPTEDVPDTNFDAGGDRRIEKEPRDGKEGTFFLPTLPIPFFGSDPKGIEDHAVPARHGKHGDGKNALKLGKGFTYLGPTPRGSKTARRTFIDAAKLNSTLVSGVADHVKSAFGAKPTPLQLNNANCYALTMKHGSSQFLVIGSDQQVASQDFMLAPIWDRDGNPHSYDVDHLHELQLGGFDGYDNFWHLDASANRSSGSLIHSRLSAAVGDLIEQAGKGAPGDKRPAKDRTFWRANHGGKKPSVDEVLETWRIEFAKLVEVPIAGDKTKFWTRDELAAGEHLKGLKPLSATQLASLGLRLDAKPSAILVFSSPSGGFYKVLKPQGKGWGPTSVKSGEQYVAPGAKVSAHPERQEFYRGFGNVTIKLDHTTEVQEGRMIGSITGTPFRVASGDGEIFSAPSVTLPLLQTPALGFGVYVDRSNLNKALSQIEVRKASPVTIRDSGISPEGDLYAEGVINTTTPLFPGIEIPFAVIGDALHIDFPIPVNRLKLGAVRATYATIGVVVSKTDLELAGEIGFAIDGLGSGRIAGAASAGKAAAPPKASGAGSAAEPSKQEQRSGFTLTGAFQFDFDKLDPAEISVTYANDKLSFDGIVGLREGAVPGVREAQIHVAHDERGTTIDGTATLGIAGLDGMTLAVSSDKDNRIAIGADNIPLPVAKLPGVKSAIASIHAERDPKGMWSVRGSGAVQAGVPGINGQLGIDIDGELLTISGAANVARGIMSGHADLLVTNRPRSPEGLPQPGPYPQVQPTDLSLTGAGQVSLQLGRLLKGTVGIKILPNEEIELSGTVALPPTVDVFPQKSFEHVLFSPPPLDIPIIGLSAAGHRFGIFATIGGALSFKASFGPGQLRDTALAVDYNPSHPEQASVHGDATFFVPAQAGLRLAIHGGIGAGLAIVDVTGGIEVGAELGIAAEASAHVAVDWTPSTGISLEANAHFAASPQFTFDVSAYVEVELDLLLKTIDVYSHRWKLASFTYGPALNFGLDVPVRWSERAGLDFDPGRVRVQRPEINIADTIGGLVHHIVG